jgi:hypothetical protein
MKEILKKTFNLDVLSVVGVVFGIGLIFQFIVFPGLTTSDTILNILALLVGIFSLLFVFHFIQWKKLFNFLSEDEKSKKEVVKKKRNTKQFPEVKSEEPFVKTRKKIKTK